jgi:hypothetical protein
MNLTTHLRLVPKPKMSGAITSLPQYALIIAWWSVKIGTTLRFYFYESTQQLNLTLIRLSNTMKQNPSLDKLIVVQVAKNFPTFYRT